MNKKNLLNFFSLSHFQNSEVINVLTIIATWTVMVIVVNPLGNFPLNDDWVYGLAVKSIIETGDFRLPSPAHTNLFFQAFWGALFCLPFGFSFTALRFSTLTLGLIGAIATYGLLREVNANQKISLLGALLIVVNPLYFGLANSFMTDVPFVALSILSFYFLIRGLKRESIIQVILGLSLVYINILIRQYAIVILLAFALAYSAKKRFKLKFLFGSSLIFLSGILLHKLYQKWLYYTNRTPVIAENFLHTRKLDFRNHILMISLIYIGCFIFPVVAIFFVKKIKEISHQQKTITILGISSFFVVVMARLIWQGKTMPLIGNVLLYFGLGPLTLRDTFLLNLNNPSYSLGLKIFWLMMTAIGVFGALLLLYYLCLAIIQTFSESEKWLKVLTISAILIYLCLFGVKYPFDRYFLPLIPLFMVLTVISNKYIADQDIGKKITAFALTMIFIFGGFTVAATHDYLAWHRTRWEALNDLMKQGITPDYIDGGYEFNGWYLNDIKYQNQRSKSYWWVNRDDYMIASGLLEGYEEVKRYPFRRWLFLKQYNIFVLHKVPEIDSSNNK